MKERRSESKSQLCRLSTLATIGRFPNTYIYAFWHVLPSVFSSFPSLFSFLPFPIGGVSSLQEKQLFPPNSRRNCHTDVSGGGRGGRTDIFAGGAPPLCSLARSLGIPETPQIHAEVTPRLSRGHRRPPLRAFSHFRVGGGRFINVEGPPCFGAGNEWTDGRSGVCPVIRFSI